MEKLSSKVFRAFMKELTINPPRSFFNKNKVIQSSVGMIFRIRCPQFPKTIQQVYKSKYERVELLFTQRASYQKDQNALNIVFPGGQCDQGENDLEACKRELQEEIGLNVDQQCMYLGQLPGNFYYLQKRGSKVFISCHIWCLQAQHFDWQPSLNPDQLREAKWVDYEHLLSPQNYVIKNALRLGILDRVIHRYAWAAKISRNITLVRLPELDLGMNRNLWGLTFWLWTYSLQMARRNMVEESEKDKNKDQLELLKLLGNHTRKMDVQFKPYYVLKYPVLGAIKVWHTLNRVRPFTYQRKTETRAKLIVLMIFTLGLLFSLISL